MTGRMVFSDALTTQCSVIFYQFLGFMSCCVPCLPEARIYTKIRDDDNLILYTCVFCFIDLIGCFTCATCFLRTQVRKNYSIEGNMVFDFFISCCCMCCAIVQMHSQAE
ncbi:hypothetical protein MHBO_000299 [Bonamia ostreae]|uniref:Uncharacterized protein n=1 Tax=Bonamia ostreae TaxID=126728 RepID=A0ABV2AFU6_9EUKA